MHNARQIRGSLLPFCCKTCKNTILYVYFFGAVFSVLLAQDGLPGEQWAGAAAAAAAALALALSFLCAMLRPLHLRPSGLSNFVVMVAAW